MFIYDLMLDLIFKPNLSLCLSERCISQTSQNFNCSVISRLNNYGEMLTRLSPIDRLVFNLPSQDAFLASAAALSPIKKGLFTVARPWINGYAILRVNCISLVR